MNPSLTVSFLHAERSPAVVEHVEAELARLAGHCDRIMNCRVMIEAPHPHHRHGGRYGVRVDLHLPGHEIVVHHEPSVRQVTGGAITGTRHNELNAPHKDVYVALSDAFDATRRQLEDYVQKSRSKHKGESIKHTQPLDT